MHSTIANKTLKTILASEGSNAIFEAYRENGGVVVKDLLSADQVNAINADIAPAMKKVAAGSTVDDAEQKAFHGDQTKRFTNIFPLSRTYRENVLDNDLLYDLCDRVFLEESGSYWLSTSQVIEIGPGNAAQPLHRDQIAFPAWTALGADGPEAVINFFIALTPFTDENGATRVIPDSHKWPDFTDLGSPEETIPATMDAGDVFMFSGKVVHGGGANRTADFYRRGLAFAVTPGYLTPEEAWAFHLDRDLVKQCSPRVQAMLGFRSVYPKDSAGLWMHQYIELAEYLEL